MELQEIDVFIEPDGQVRLEVRGAKGTHCLALTKDLEKALGDQVLSREMTPEAHERSPEQVPDRQWL
ncbi:MAG: DUF2997 domain-containing protein [Chloroflexi bacterium]|nr:DUF2997 domain-containing protein [Chloroflexota bacterium]